MDPNVEVRDPQTTAERLAQIATERPDLAGLIGAHPNAYPELRAWAVEVSAQMSPGSSYPHAGPSSGYPPAVAALSPQSKPKQTGLIIGLIAGALVVVASIATLFLSGVFAGGAKTPQAAVEQLLNSAADGDLSGLGGALPESEVTTFARAFMNGLDDAEAQDADLGAAADDLQAFVRAANVNFKNLTFEEVEIAEDVVRVVITGGTAWAEGSAAEIASAGATLSEELLAAEGTLSPSEVADGKVQVEEELIRILTSEDRELTFDFGKTSAEAPLQVSMVTVKENGRWYVSPLMTLADYMVLVAEDAGSLPLGTKVLAPVSSRSPEEAVSVSVSAAFNEDVAGLARTLPLAERRLLSIYGPAMLERGVISGGSADDGGPSVSHQVYTATDHGSWAVLKPKEVVYDLGGERFTVSGECVTTVGQTDCLSDIEGFPAIDLSGGMIVAIREGGFWFTSPIATAGYLTGKLVSGGAGQEGTSYGLNRSGSPVDEEAFTPSSNGETLEDLSGKCLDGNMTACDDLYFESPTGSAYEEIGDTCGFTRPAGGYCTDGS